MESTIRDPRQSSPSASPPSRPACPHRKVGVGELVIGERARRYVLEVIDSGRLSYGPFSRNFEAEFARNHDVPHAMFCSSGTAALQMAIAALAQQRRWQSGDEVIVPAVTFVATVNAVLHAGLKPVLADVLPDTYTIDPERISQAVTDRTRCIIPVHLLGLPADMDAVMDIAGQHDLAVVEDSCECMFARYKGRAVGSFGDVGCFSTYVAHLLCTGVGGLTTTRDPELAALLRSLMNHGRDNIYITIDDDDGVSGGLFHEIVDRRYRFERVGYSNRCTEMEAALGLAQIEEWKPAWEARHRNAEFFTRQLADLSDRLQLPTVPGDRTHAFMIYGLVTREEPMADLVHYLEDHGVETRGMLPLIRQPAYRDLFGRDVGRRHPVADHLHDRAFYVGCHSHLTDDDRQHVVATIRSYFGQ